MLVTFSGLDGAGKTTLIAALSDELRARGRRVAVLTMYDHVGAYATVRGVRDRILLRAPAGSTEGAEESRTGAGPRARMVAVAYRTVRSAALKKVVYVVDLLLFALYRLWIEGVQRKVLVLDRYFYDSLVDIANGSRRYVDRFLAFVPEPDLAVYVDVEPEEAFRRKGEYGVAALRLRQVEYRRLFKQLRSPVIIPNVDAELAKRALRAALDARLR